MVTPLMVMMPLWWVKPEAVAVGVAGGARKGQYIYCIFEFNC
jgi:hypothetical protein